MPVKVTKVDGYKVTHGGQVSAKSTTLAKAKRQRNLLNAVRHGWRPTGKKARDMRKKKKKKGNPYTEGLAKAKAGTPAGYRAGLWGQKIRSKGRGRGLGRGKGRGPIGRPFNA